MPSQVICAVGLPALTGVSELLGDLSGFGLKWGRDLLEKKKKSCFMLSHE